MSTVAVFNDTGTGWHFGCDAVMETLTQALRDRGLEISYRHGGGKSWQRDLAALAAIDAASVVVVNGEGTIHHSRHKAEELAALGRYCAARGRPAFLINATIEANSPAMMKEILAFTAIYVRDTASKREVELAGGEATVTGDLSFGVELPPWRPSTSQPVVVDSTLRRQTRNLGRIALGLNANFVSMKYADGIAFAKRAWLPGYRRKGRKPLPSVDDFRSFAAYLGSHGHMVTGRYHALCFAINMGMPFSVTPSNTRKSQALMADAGINMQRVFTGRSPPLLGITDEDRVAMQRYVAGAREDQRVMFDHIATAA